jgi:hypothetical protein
MGKLSQFNGILYFEEKMRTLMMCFVSDPYHALLFRESFDIFKDEFDQVIVGISGKIPKVNDFIKELYKDCEVPWIVYYHMNQGQVFDKIYPHVKGDILITMDSDNYIFKKGIISRYSSLIEKGEYDIVGTHGKHAKPSEFADALIKKFGYVRINPFMSFWKKELIDKLDNLTFQSRVWVQAGMYDREIDWKMETDSSLDHMGILTLRLIRNGARINIIPAENPPEWIHPGAMATAIKHHLLRDDATASLDGSDKKTCYNPVNIGLLGRWYFTWRRTKDKYPDKEFNDEYYRAIERKAGVSKLTMKQIIDYADGLERDWNGYKA